MMERIYSSPFRVYLVLAFFAFCGIYSGSGLRISLFPNSSKPTIGVQIPYGNNTVTEFVDQHGKRLQSRFRSISTESVEIEKFRAFYQPDMARFEVEFHWGSEAQTALKEVETIVHSYAIQFPEDVRQQIQIYPQSDQAGFFAASFYSPLRSLDDVYKIVEPILIPQISKIKDAAVPELWNPAEKEVRIELHPERMAAFQLFPKDIELAVKNALTSFSGGSVIERGFPLSVQLPKQLNKIDDLKEVLVTTPSKKNIHLTDLAHIDFDLKTTNTLSIKTSGTASLILFTRPKAGGNVKQLSEEIIKTIQRSMSLFPKDIQYKILVDPSEFIRAAVRNVVQEVVLGAVLTVLVLFLFIGNFKNTITAAIEIPLSILLALIPMKFLDMNLNLISLGGLALSAGMNVDASVVVMENILRNFGKKENKENPLDYAKKLKILVQAVNEVKFSVITSTIASLVVFLPLSFTSKLTYAVLGDLAKVVVFSHGFSALVALILVPTIRLHLLSQDSSHHSYDAHSTSPKKRKFLEFFHSQKSPLEKQLHFLEGAYVKALKIFIKNKKLQKAVYAFLSLILFSLVFFILPKIPTELIGKPDTDWIQINIQTQGNSILKQMESSTEKLEAQLLKKFEKRIFYSFTQISDPNHACVMFRLKHKRQMKIFWKELETDLINTPLFTYDISPWNPAELPMPDLPELKLVIQGGTQQERTRILRDLYQMLEENQAFPRLASHTAVVRTEGLTIRPYLQLWFQLSHAVPSDLADVARVMTTGRKIGELKVDEIMRDITMKYTGNPSHVHLDSIPLGVEEKIVPLKALAKVEIEEVTPSIYQEDQRELDLILGKKNEGDTFELNKKRLEKTKNLVEAWKKDKAHYFQTSSNAPPLVFFEDSKKEIHESLKQLFEALLLSVLVIFLILVIQFGDFIHAILVLVAIPLGFIGVISSLLIFRSTLSLNSMLGMILLNGIAVANSIILVDFLRQKVREGLSPLDAALEAAEKRLRPILITSFTSILGMLPIALGLGEGGGILQPLGIAVSGGLWVSMTLTLFIVPALQVQYLDWKKSFLNKMKTRRAAL